MSKILELLNYHRKNRKETSKEHLDPAALDNFNSDTKEKLANTYIFNPIDKIENIGEGGNGEILPPKRDRETSKSKFVQFLPWLVAFLAVLLLLVNIAYRGKVNVTIEFLKGESSQAASNVAESKRGLTSETGEEAASYLKTTDIAPISTALIAEGGLNRFIVKRLGFYGAALSKSRAIRDGLFLFNDGATGWASVGLDFVEPMDLSNSTLDFFVKGKHGNESLNLFLRDAENNSYMPQAHNTIFEENMEREWQFVSIPFNTFDGVYNSKRINHIGFEFGTQTAANEPGASIYIKNMKIVKSADAIYGNMGR